MLTFIAWAFSVDIWDSEVVQFNPLETEYSATEKVCALFLCIIVIYLFSTMYKMWSLRSITNVR